MIRDVDANDGAMSVCPPPGDMNEVMGQETAKWALEVAAAGGHHLMMTGPPGTGKTMLASRIPGTHEPLNETEQLEVPRFVRYAARFPDTESATFHRSRRPTIPRRPPRWWVEARDWPSRSHHPRASRHPVHGRGSGILGAYAADAARTFGIRICRNFQSERHHILLRLASN